VITEICVLKRISDFLKVSEEMLGAAQRDVSIDVKNAVLVIQMVIVL
jgi:hypothetical protein